VTKNQFGLIVGFMPLGSMMSCVFVGIFRHKYGTKRTMQLFSMPAVLGSACITAPWNIYMVMINLVQGLVSRATWGTPTTQPPLFT